jgi:hypothetical protein
MRREKIYIRAPQRPQLDRKCHVPADDHGAAEVLSKDGLALAKASMLQRANHALVLRAVQQEGLALQFASEELKANPVVVKTAVDQNPRAWRHGTDELRISTELLEVAIRESQRLLSNGSPQLSLEECEPAVDRSFVFVFETGGKQMRARAKMSKEEVRRLPLLQAIIDSADRGFHSPQTDKNDAVVVQIPLCVSPEELRAFVAGRRASLSDFVLADFFAEPALRHVFITYLEECRTKSFEGSFHNFLTFYPGLVRLVCQSGPELGISNKALRELFCEHCWQRIPLKRLKNFDRTVEQIASKIDTVSLLCTCAACQNL